MEDMEEKHWKSEDPKTYFECTMIQKNSFHCINTTPY